MEGTTSREKERDRGYRNVGRSRLKYITVLYENIAVKLIACKNMQFKWYQFKEMKWLGVMAYILNPSNNKKLGRWISVWIKLGLYIKFQTRPGYISKNLSQMIKQKQLSGKKSLRIENRITVVRECELLTWLIGFQF